MRHLMKWNLLGAAAVAGAMMSAPASAQEVLIGIEAPASTAGVAIAAPVGLLLHEAVQAANGKKAFGPNGEVMKVLAAGVKIMDGNVKGAERESGEVAKVIRATTWRLLHRSAARYRSPRPCRTGAS